jgi:hypothetical protein
MSTDLGLMAWLISFIWFMVYWILGGVFFSIMAVLRLGGVRKVRFSCLFTVCAAGAGWGGMRLASDAVEDCLVSSESQAEAVTAVFGCGFVGIFSAFLLGLIVLIGLGSLLLKISTVKTKPWIVLEEKEENR